MLIPHDRTKPLKVSVSFLFMCIFMISWTALTVWSGYLTTRHFDYVKTKFDNKVMHARLLLFANQLEKAKNMFEKVQGNDKKIRMLLAMGTKKSILESGQEQNFGKGGPTLSQTTAFAAILSSGLNKMNYSEILHEADVLCEQYKFMCRSYEEIMAYIHKQKLLFVVTPSGWPCRGRISSGYGFRVHPVLCSKEFHPGIDIANTLNTSISSTAAGRVVFSGYLTGYGNVIVISHGRGGYRTIYAHLSKRLVNVGACVSRGNIIAKMGSTGTSTGSHLHYEVHFKENHVNPKPYLMNYPYVQSEKKGHYVQKKLKKSA
jgi:murein DD-endopeptidase MepM/ murein hydrolase activator NlpD